MPSVSQQINSLPQGACVQNPAELSSSSHESIQQQSATSSKKEDNPLIEDLFQMDHGLTSHDDSLDDSTFKDRRAANQDYLSINGNSDEDFEGEFEAKTCKEGTYLVGHYRNRATTRINTVLKCGVTGCGKAFNKKSNLLDHLRTHTGEAPYYCKFCQKGFKQKGQMYKHKRTMKHQRTTRKVKAEERKARLLAAEQKEA